MSASVTVCATMACGPGERMSVPYRGVSGPPPATFCDRCGRPRAIGDHGARAAARALEPPRHCATCGRRLVVQVTPRGWRARCVEHGEVTS